MSERQADHRACLAFRCSATCIASRLTTRIKNLGITSITRDYRHVREAATMEDKHSFEAIDEATFNRVLQQYTSSLSPDVSEQLDDLRYKTIPDAVRARGDDPCIDKEQVVHLVIWKLYVYPGGRSASRTRAPFRWLTT